MKLDSDLQCAISELLELDAHEIEENAHCTFIELGGNSVKALELTFKLDSAGKTLDIETVLAEDSSVLILSQSLQQNTPNEAESGESTTEPPTPDVQTPDTETSEDNGSDLTNDPNLEHEASKLLNCSENNIECVLPLTSQQRGLWLGSLQGPDVYLSHWQFQLSEDVDLERLKRAWARVVTANAILRTRILALSDSKLHQVVLQKDYYDDNLNFLEQTEILPEETKPLFGIHVDSSNILNIYCHHVLYDRWSMKLILQDVQSAYDHDGELPLRPSYVPFLDGLRKEELDAQMELWRSPVNGESAIAVPSVKPSRGFPVASKSIDTTASIGSPKNATLAQVIAAAWSFVTSKHAGANRVSFGLTIWGRDIGLPGVRDMAFPTFNTMPFVSTMAENDSVESLLATTRAHLSLLRRTQRLDVETISSINSACHDACKFNSILVVQQDAPVYGESGLFTSATLSSFDTTQSSPLILECTPTGKRLVLRMKYDPSLVADIDADILLHHLKTALETFCSGHDQQLSDIDLLGERDLQLIRDWVVPSIGLKESTLHDLVKESSLKHAESTAIWTSEVTLTYRQLLDHARNVAGKVLSLDSEISPNIGVCFEKSAYAVVAMLGISMSGHAFVPMDASNPFNRLIQLYENAQMKLVVCSRAMASKFNASNIKTLVVDAETLTEDAPLEEKSVASDPERNVYIIYTSGSTGEPKGVVMTHQALCTTLEAIADHLEFGPHTRDLQFSSFAFDMSVHDIWCTLLRGGTLCIPTEAERYDLEDFLDRAKCNYAMFTPSVALTLSDDSWKRFDKFSVSGEPLPKAVFRSALQADVKFWNTYGPTESCIICITNSIDAMDANPSRLGYSMAATSWVIDADNPHRLAPVGCVGELALTGHTLAAGYYQDTEKTDKAFVRGLEWTREFPDHPLGKVYRTGDLAKYNSDGSIEFQGRLGGYIKIAGNRVDLGEIEFVLHSKCDLPKVSIQYCAIGTKEKRDLLVGFCAEPQVKRSEDTELLPLTEATRERVSKGLRRLREHLPRYMIPVMFFPITRFPYNTAGKLDKKRLVSLVSDRDVEEMLEQYGVDTQTNKVSEEPTDEKVLSKEAATLREAWATVLKSDASKISSRSNFFELGGDSLRALNLGATLRRLKWAISVSDVFKHPSLSDMASCLRNLESDSSSQKNQEVQTFERLEQLKPVAADVLKLSTSQIDYLVPCTSLQTQMLAASAQSSTYIHRECFKLEASASNAEIRSVCQFLGQQNELLRSRAFVDGETGAFILAVLKSSVDVSFIEMNDTLDEYVSKDTERLGLDRELVRFVLLKHDKERTLVWETHHSIFDGYSNILLIKQFREIATRLRADGGSDEETTSVASFKDFVSFTLNADQEAAKTFWSKYLDNAPKLQFMPGHPMPRIRATNAKSSQQVEFKSQTSEITTAIAVRAAFAITLSRYACSDDVVFSATNHGRDLPVKNIESLAGPTFSTLPVRCIMDRNESLRDFMARIQLEAAEIATYQYMSVEVIEAIDSNCREACQFDIHLLVQSAASEPPFDELKDLGYLSLPDPSPMSLQIPFNLVVTGRKDVIDLDVIYNNTMFMDDHVRLFLDQFAYTLKQVLEMDKGKPIHSIRDLGDQNREICLSIQPKLTGTTQQTDLTIPELVFKDLDVRKDDQALFSTETCFTYQEMYDIATALSRQINDRVGDTPQYVATAYEKSPWAIIVQLAVLIAGHAYVSLDVSWTEAKAETVLKQVDAQLVITSSSMQRKFPKLVERSMLFEPDRRPSENNPSDTFYMQARSNHPAYVIFTSGSTGTPKGVVVEHSAICHTVCMYKKRLAITNKTRALLFASFAFDASVMETWSVLAAGGTLCIASEEERIGNMDAFLLQSRADCVGLTPTSAMLLDPAKHDRLATLLFCGEKTKAKDIARWSNKPNLRLVNAYGPSEASVNAVMNTDFSQDDLSNIGQSMGGGLHVVDPKDHNILVPVGGVGELLITGPVLAKEYLGDPEKTAEKFVLPQWPKWTNTQGQKAYKTGDLVRLDLEGNMHFVGRHDGQMKVNGVRIEAGEIENAAQQSVDDQFKEVIVSARLAGDDESGDELILFFVPLGREHAKESVVSILPLTNINQQVIEQLHEGLRNSLSKAYIPSLYVPISHVPTGNTGKIDRKKLNEALDELHVAQINLYRPMDEEVSAQKATQPTATTHTVKMSDTESRLASMWSQVLHRVTKASITPTSHFIKVGGDSITAIRLASTAKSQKLNLTVTLIYAHPILKDMAAAVDAEDTSSPEIQDLTTPAPFELLDEDMLSPLMTRRTPSATTQRDYFGTSAR